MSIPYGMFVTMQNPTPLLLSGVPLQEPWSHSCGIPSCHGRRELPHQGVHEKDMGASDSRSSRGLHVQVCGALEHRRPWQTPGLPCVHLARLPRLSGVPFSHYLSWCLWEVPKYPVLGEYGTSWVFQRSPTSDSLLSSIPLSFSFLTWLVQSSILPCLFAGSSQALSLIFMIIFLNEFDNLCDPPRRGTR